jgi:hypothetical protein
MKTSKLENPHIRSEVVRRFAGGETQAAIARDFGVHRSQVSRFAKREDIRPSIETEQLKLPESVPDAVENVKDLVTAMKDIPKDDTKGVILPGQPGHPQNGWHNALPYPVSGNNHNL